jgi:hypothetical protein
MTDVPPPGHEKFNVTFQSEIVIFPSPATVTVNVPLKYTPDGAFGS